MDFYGKSNDVHAPSFHVYAVLPSQRFCPNAMGPGTFVGPTVGLRWFPGLPGCHTYLYKIQEASNHARSLRPLKEIGEITPRLPFRLMDRTSQSELFLSRKPDGNIELSARKDGKEDQIILEWAFGAGAKGITLVGRRDNGQFVEGRLSWYAALGTFDLTAGALEHTAQDISQSLGRSLGEEERSRCFGCHTTASTAESPIPSREEMGIRCERCHGPGLEHIRSMSTRQPIQTERSFIQEGSMASLRLNCAVNVTVLLLLTLTLTLSAIFSKKP